MTDRRSLRIFVVAGEPSGDALGAGLMNALKSETHQSLRFSGIGGRQMISEGLDSLFPISELSVMGLAEVLPRLPRLMRRLDQTVAAARTFQPDIMITIDSPGFTVRLARRLGDTNFPKVHYVAPSVWAWRPGRAKKIAKVFDHLLALLPFEPPYFENVGLPCDFVGHPAVFSETQIDRDSFRSSHAIADDALVLAVLCGSRSGEVSRLAPLFCEVATMAGKKFPNLHVLTVVPETVRDIVSGYFSNLPMPVTLISDPEHRIDAFSASDVALAASGTVTLELASAGTPMVVAYRMAPLTMAIARRLVKVPYASLVNIVLNREAVPERIQSEATADSLAKDVIRLLVDPNERDAQIRDLNEALSQLRGNSLSPSTKAAEVILNLTNTFDIHSKEERAHK